MSNVIVPASYYGVTPKDFARNGLGANAQCLRSVAGLANHVLAYHGTVLPAMEVLPASARSEATASRLWTQYYQSTPNGTTLVSRVYMVPGETADPLYYLSLDGVDQDARHHGRGNPTSATLTLDDIFVDEQEITVTASAAHRVDLYTDNNCLVVGWQLYEKDRPTLDTATDTVIDTSRIIAPGQVLDADWTDVTGAIDTAWKQCRGYYGSFNVDDPATPIAGTGTYTNIWDGTTSRSATSLGFLCPTQYRTSYMGTTVPVVCWALAERASGATNVVARFVSSAGNIIITCNGALGIYTATGTLPITAGGEKVDVQFYVNGASTGNLYACGIYPLVS